MNQKCKEYVYVRDTYRYTGGRHRFKMHYERKQCSRLARVDGYCRQHASIHGLLTKGAAH